MGKIGWTEKAGTHLQAIHAYIAVDPPTYADRFIQSLVKSVSALNSMPHLGRIVPEMENLRLNTHHSELKTAIPEPSALCRP